MNEIKLQSNSKIVHGFCINKNTNEQINNKKLIEKNKNNQNNIKKQLLLYEKKENINTKKNDINKNIIKDAKKAITLFKKVLIQIQIKIKISNKFILKKKRI